MNLTPMPTHWTSALEAISSQLASASSLLVACDFDGTISEIVPQPWDAVPLPRAVAALVALAGRQDVKVAMVSGRDLADVTRRVEIPNAAYSGNHGLQFSGFGLDEAVIDGESISEWMGEIALRAGDLLSGIPGIMIENKGFTVSIHYRNVPTEFWDQVAEAAAAAIDPTPATELNKGNMVWEIKPKIGMNKGTAVMGLCESLGIPTNAVIYIGDDTTDETVFSALPDGVTVRVGSAFETSARWLAHNPEDVADFLEWLVKTKAQS